MDLTQLANLGEFIGGVAPALRYRMPLYKEESIL